MVPTKLPNFRLIYACSSSLEICSELEKTPGGPPLVNSVAVYQQTFFTAIEAASQISSVTNHRPNPLNFKLRIGSFSPKDVCDFLS